MRIVSLSARFLLTVAAAAMLSACSSSLERFSAENTSYDNPSDADPVYTAAIQRAKPRVVKTADTYQAPQVDALVEEPITSKPLAKAAINKPKLAYDYSGSYGKKPAYKQPKLTLNEREPAYEAVEEPEVVAPIKKIAKPKIAAVEPSFEPGAKPAVVPKSGRIRVQPGMTLAQIAKSNGVTTEELAQANGLKKPYWVSAGTVLLVPGVITPTAPRSTLQSQKQQVEEQGTSLAAEEEIQVAPKKKFVAASGAHTVGSGETLYSLGRKYGVSPFAISEANGLDRNAPLSLGQQVKIPGASAGKIASAPKLAEKPKLIEEETIGDEEPQVFAKPKKKLTLKDEPKDQEKIVEVEQEEPAVEEKVAEAPVKKDLKLKVPKVETAPAAQSLALRWPVRGKVISEFGPKSGGLKNEGINISVPEGTSIRAAESGVVAYAGNELKGYGNLILVRHEGGYVTAYAHAKELIVKRGDKVKRGDVIAKAGQSGAVSSPQVHFEVRKGASALDPNKFLGSSTAMN